MGYIIIVIKRSECIIYVIAIALTIPSPIHMNILIWLIVCALQHPSPTDRESFFMRFDVVDRKESNPGFPALTASSNVPSSITARTGVSEAGLEEISAKPFSLSYSTTYMNVSSERLGLPPTTLTPPLRAMRPCVRELTPSICAAISLAICTASAADRNSATSWVGGISISPSISA